MNVGASVNAGSSGAGGGGRSSRRSKHQGPVDLVVSKLVCPFVTLDLDVQLHRKLNKSCTYSQVDVLTRDYHFSIYGQIRDSRVSFNCPYKGCPWSQTFVQTRNISFPR